MHKIYLFFKIVKKYEMISKTQLKKLKNFLETESKKDASKQAKEVRIRFYLIKFKYSRHFCSFLKFKKAEDAARREKNIEEAKKVIIKEDASLPKAKTVTNFFKTRTHYVLQMNL